MCSVLPQILDNTENIFGLSHVGIRCLEFIEIVLEIANFTREFCVCVCKTCIEHHAMYKNSVKLAFIQKVVQWP